MVATFTVSRYLTAIAVTAYLWDYLLTFGDEVALIWGKRRRGPSYICFLWNRYSTIVGLVYGAFLTSGLQLPVGDSICKASYVTEAILAIVATATAHGYIALRLFKLWEYKRTAEVILWTSFVATFLGLAVSCVLAARDIHQDVHYVSKLCIISRSPTPFLGVWVSMLTFDFVTVVLVVGNALHQPYREGVQVLERVKRDGVMSFLAVVVASFVMLSMSVAGGPGGVLEVAFIAWAWNAVVISRLVLRVESANSPRRRLNVYQMDVLISPNSPN